MTRHAQLPPPAVVPPPVSFMALIATQDITEDDEILIHKVADFLGNVITPDDKADGIRYRTNQRQRPNQGLLHKAVHAVPIDPFVQDGGHLG